MSVNTRAEVSFIGFGEVGQTFARDLAARGDVTLAAYDILFDAGARGAPLRDRAATLGVRTDSTAAAAAATAGVVVSAVTAAAVLDVAQGAASFLRPGQIYLDVNSASPATKTRAAKLVEAAGAHYVEGAVMAPVLAPGLRVPILAGGPKAADAAELLNALGMNLRAVSVEHGRASAMKLCRSIIIKGLEALMVDCAAAAAKWDVADEVFASLSESYPSIDWPALSLNMGERVARHGARRAAEMREAADMLADLQMSPALALAVADAQARGAVPKV